jgi:L-alanine-DL-glutamate epimerase-like enolase superfamily enzyme
VAKERGEGIVDCRIERLRAAAYTIPTDARESDGTLEWSETTLVLVELTAGRVTGLGYTYADAAAAPLIATKLTEVVCGRDAFATAALHQEMRKTLRNLGAVGLGADLKAKLLNTSLIRVLGAASTAVPVYGSGGFTAYSVKRLCEQLAGWVEEGITQVKMKVGRDPHEDVWRVRAAREAIGPDVALFVDANGAYDRQQALAKAEEFAELGVTWFEEPVSQDDVAGLRLLRDRAPAGLEITSGEYAWSPVDFRRLIEAGAVDVLQADMTRCGGVTGFLNAAAQCEAASLPLSAHGAPALHAPICCALPRVRHVEWFYDHVRIERMLFDGVPRIDAGMLCPDRERPGFGVELKRGDAERFLVWQGRE